MTTNQPKDPTPPADAPTAALFITEQQQQLLQTNLLDVVTDTGSNTKARRCQDILRELATLVYP